MRLMRNAVAPLVLAVAWSLLPSTSVPADAALRTAGSVERAYLLGDKPLVLHAKLDTSVAQTSLDVSDLRSVEKDSATFVTFKVAGRAGTPIALERPVHRWVEVKRLIGGNARHPVVALKLCLGGVTREVDVLLMHGNQDRYPLVIGRDFIESRFTVDASVAYRVSDGCVEPPPPVRATAADAIATEPPATVKSAQEAAPAQPAPSRRAAPASDAKPGSTQRSATSTEKAKPEAKSRATDSSQRTPGGIEGLLLPGR